MFAEALDVKLPPNPKVAELVLQDLSRERTRRTLVEVARECVVLQVQTEHVLVFSFGMHRWQKKQKCIPGGKTNGPEMGAIDF